MQKIAPGPISRTATISYISPMEDKLTREVQQRRVWHFSCSCSLCMEEDLVELQKHSLKCSVDNCEGGRPVSFKEQQEDKEDYETQDEKDEVYTDVVELEESEDSEDAQVIDLVEVQVDKVKVNHNNVKIMELEETDQEGARNTREENAGKSNHLVLPCWLCGSASPVDDEVRVKMRIQCPFIENGPLLTLNQ